MLLSLNIFSVSAAERMINNDSYAVSVSAYQINDRSVEHHFVSMTCSQSIGNTSDTYGMNAESVLISNLLQSNPKAKESPPVFDEIAKQNMLFEHRRFVSADHRAGNGKEPEFFLLIAFAEPQLNKLASSPVLRPHFSQHWTSQSASGVSRLSGWKDTNSLYTHLHRRFS